MGIYTWQIFGSPFYPLLESVRCMHVETLGGMCLEHGLLAVAEDGSDEAPHRVVVEKIKEIYVGLCFVAYDKQKKCTRACSCWVRGQQGHCTHKYAVEEYVGEKKWTADQPLPAARVATFERDSSVEPPKRRRQ